MASIASLLAPSVSIPQSNFSWLDAAFDNVGGAIQRGKENRSFNRLADLIGQQPTGQSASLVTGAAPQPQTMAAPVMPVDRSAPQGDTYRPFIDAVRGKITNPYGLAAVAATGRAESGWSGANANRTWSDPSQRGDPGTAGGILSWRGPRLASLQAYAASKGEQGNGSPQTQAEFLLQENPQLIDQLNSARSPEEAANLMANAWKFAGYDQPGGEAARRRALTQNYYAQEFAGQPNSAAAAIEAQAPGGMGSPLTEQAFDDRFGPSALPAEVAQTPEALATALTDTNRPAASSMPVNAPAQVADTSGGFTNVPGVSPIQRGGVPIEMIQELIRDPNLRQIGLKLWQQNATGSTGEPWQFVQAPDGTLLRANQQTGTIERVGSFTKQNELPNSYREYQLARESGFQGSYADWEKVKSPGTTVTVNNQDEGEFAKKAAGRNVERFGNIADGGTAAVNVSQSIPVMREILAEAPQGPLLGRLAERYPGFSTAGDAFMAQVNQIAPTLRIPGSGAQSDRDMDILMGSFPRLRNNPETNAIIMDLFERKAQLNVQRAEIAAAALRGEIKPAEADRRLSELEKTPLLNPRLRSLFENRKGGGSDAGSTKSGLKWSIEP